VIGYFDTSAFVPLLVEENTSFRCRLLWRMADVVVSNRLLPLEATSALHQAFRLHRIDRGRLSRAFDRVDALWEECSPVEIDDALVTRARQCMDAVPLRAYDTAHCAAGLLIAEEPDAVLISGDLKLLAAWRHFGATVVDINHAAG
jgi:predicted nucleic acid-binding protein